jgi:hypothetical protein
MDLLNLLMLEVKWGSLSKFFSTSVITHTFTQVFMPAASATWKHTHTSELCTSLLIESIFYCHVVCQTAHDIILHSKSCWCLLCISLTQAIRNTLCGCIKVQKLGNNSKKWNSEKFFKYLHYKLIFYSTDTITYWLVQKSLGTHNEQQKGYQHWHFQWDWWQHVACGDSTHSTNDETVCRCRPETVNISNCVVSTYKHSCQYI